MIYQSLPGLAAFTGIAWLISENRNQVRYKLVLTGIVIQLIIGAILVKVPLFREFFLILNRLVLTLEGATREGTSFVFGYLGGGILPFPEKFPGAGFIIAFQALPLVLVMSALTALLFHWKILPLIVRQFSLALQKTMGIGGAEGLGISANVFVGMVESPLFIRPYLNAMTRSEIFTLMTCGMATIAGTVMVLYAGILKDVLPDVMGHILTASIISVPAAVTIAKIMVPETASPTRNPSVGQEATYAKSLNAMDAVTQGTLQGVQLMINIIAMLVVIIALVHLVNLLLGFLPELGGQPITLQHLLGILMAPVTWLMGIPWNEAVAAGALLGTKTVLNEFIAYLDMSQLGPGVLSDKSLLIMTYALCGFANPGSLGIMIGGLGTMAPQRRDEIVGLGLRSVVAGTLATCMTGAVIGVLV